MVNMQVKKQSGFSFRLMALEFRLRDLLHPPAGILRDIGIQLGMSVLDFGCGPGSFSLAAAKLVGPKGVVFAVDTNPLAPKTTGCAARRRRLENAHPISSDRIKNLSRGSIDATLLYDVLHEIDEPQPVFAESSRLLKPGGIFSASDHRLGEKTLQDLVVGSGFFRVIGRIKTRFSIEPLKAALW